MGRKLTATHASMSAYAEPARPSGRAAPAPGACQRDAKLTASPQHQTQSLRNVHRTPGYATLIDLQIRSCKAKSPDPVGAGGQITLPATSDASAMSLSLRYSLRMA